MWAVFVDELQAALEADGVGVETGFDLRTHETSRMICRTGCPIEGWALRLRIGMMVIVDNSEPVFGGGHELENGHT